MEEIICRAWTKNGYMNLTKKEWFSFDHNLLHREDGPAVKYVNETEWWCLNGKRHRESGPAVVWESGPGEWWVNNKLHRLDGPAVTYSSGVRYWFINGKQIETEEIEKWLEENKVDLKTEIGQMAFKLRWV